MTKITKQKTLQLQNQLLSWFDLHQRVMPWRAVKGKLPNPYHVWLSEIMLQQTTVATVGPYFQKFVKKWPTLKRLAAADLDDVLATWAGLGYYARARNLHKCAQKVLQEYKGVLPETEQELLELPGIGPYTAAAIASIAFGQEAVAVDGNVERVVSRFFAIEEPLPPAKKIIREKATHLVKGNPTPGDFTQALMELGSLVCTPRNPKCGVCPWVSSCAAYKKKKAEELPRFSPKTKRPVLYGKVFWIFDDKNKKFLIEKRKDKGLYAGMYQLPTTEWVRDKKSVESKAVGFSDRISAKNSGVTVRHSFSHFDLVLEIWGAEALSIKNQDKYTWAPYQGFEKYALPTLMKKALLLCLKKKL